MVNQYLSHYEIQLENALTELRSASKLEPYPGTNPYREPLQKAQKLLASCPGAKQQEISTGTMPVENAITLVNDMDTELAASDEERESLKAKEKEVSSHVGAGTPLRGTGLRYSGNSEAEAHQIPVQDVSERKASRSFRHSPTARMRRSCSNATNQTNYISLLYFTPDITSDRIDTSSRPCSSRGSISRMSRRTPKTEVRTSGKRACKSESKGTGPGRKRFRVPADETDQSPGCQPGAEIL